MGGGSIWGRAGRSQAQCRIQTGLLFRYYSTVLYPCHPRTYLLARILEIGTNNFGYIFFKLVWEMSCDVRDFGPLTHIYSLAASKQGGGAMDKRRIFPTDWS